MRQLIHPEKGVQESKVREKGMLCFEHVQFVTPIGERGAYNDRSLG